MTGRKIAWTICGLGLVLALAAVFFLPAQIPTHFSGGIADQYSDRNLIFLFPAAQCIIVFLSGREKIKYFIMHAKSAWTEAQYYLIVCGLTALILAAQAGITYSALG